MKPINTPRYRLAVAVARARVKWLAKELDTMADDEAFSHLWVLAFIDLRDLENFRNPS
jgi:hypothetical protein